MSETTQEAEALAQAYEGAATYLGGSTITPAQADTWALAIAMLRTRAQQIRQYNSVPSRVVITHDDGRGSMQGFIR